MATYRYSQRGVGTLSGRAARQTLILTLLATLVGLGIVVTRSGIWDWQQLAAVLVVFVGVQVLVVWAAKAKATRLAQSTAITVDLEGVTCRNDVATVTIPRGVGLSPRVRHEFRHSRLGSDFALDSLVQV